MKTLLLLGALTAPVVALAQETQTLEPIVVTATRSAQKENRLPAAVTVITREDIERSGATHVVDVLRGSGLAQVSDFFGDGSRTQIDLRGLGDGAHSSTLILVDGRRLNNPDISAPDLNSIALKDIERIEILNGSAGALYGDQAVGGVINIITRSAQKSGSELTTSVGSFGALGARAQWTQAADSGALRLSAESRDRDNYRDHNRLRYRNVFGYGETRIGETRVFAEAGYVDEQLDTPGALFAAEVAQDRRQSTANFANDFSDTRTRTGRIGASLPIRPDWTLDAEASHRRSDGTFRLAFACCGPSTQDSSQDREINAINPRLVGRFATAGGEAALTVGADVQTARYQLISPLGTQRNQQDVRDIYAQLVLPLSSRLETTLGARAGRVQNEVFDGFTFVTPTRFHDSQQASQIGFALNVSDALRLFARHDGSFRYAKVDEFTNAGAPAGSNLNPLRTQTGDSYEVGSEWAAGLWTAHVNVYRLDLDDELAFDPSSFSNINLGATRRDGQTLSLAWQALPSLRLGLAYRHVDAQVKAGSFAGNTVPLVAQDSGQLSADLRLPAHFTARVEWLGVGARTFSGDFDNTLPALAGHGVINTVLVRKYGAWQSSLRINNLLNQKYSEYGVSALDGSFSEAAAFFPSPGVNASFEVGYRF